LKENTSVSLSALSAIGAHLMVLLGVPGNSHGQCLVHQVQADTTKVAVTSTTQGYVLAYIDGAGAHFLNEGGEFFTVPHFGPYEFYKIDLDAGFAVIGHVWNDLNAIGVVLVYDYLTGTKVNEWHGNTSGIDGYMGAAVATTNGRFFVGEPIPDIPCCGQVLYYDTPLATIPKSSFSSSVGRVGYSVDLWQGSFTVGATREGDDRVLTFDLDAGTTFFVFSQPGDPGFAKSFALDSGYLAVVGDGGSGTGHVYVFDAVSGAPAYDLPIPGAHKVHASDGCLALEGTTGVHVLDLVSGDHVLHIPRPSQVDDWSIRDIDGDRLALTAQIGGVPHVMVYSVPRPWNDANGNGYDDGCEWVPGPTQDHWYTTAPRGAWDEGEGVAVGLGGHLATIRNQAENDWLLDTFLTVEPMWIGLTDQEQEGVFSWTSGESASYENWLVGEPDNGNGADWAVMSPILGTWLDEPQLPERVGIVELLSDDCDGDGQPDAYQIGLEPWLDWNGDGVLDGCAAPNYCTVTPNSTGVAAVIGASGTPVVTENAFTLEAWNLPLNEFAYFLTSESTGFVPNFGGSSGNLCLGAPQYRFNMPAGGGQVLNSGATGTVSFTLDLNLLPQGITFDPGETWYFQLWFRDFTTGPTSNTTDGIEVMFR
jgi:hypothetical protein